MSRYKKASYSRTILFFLLLLLIATRFFNSYGTHDRETVPSLSTSSLTEAFQEQRSNLQVEGEGTVAKILPDDLKGSRHQRIILRVSSNHTVLIAHNIDLAPRIPDAKKGDTLNYYGEYKWNEKGGVIHWTHHDPQGRHPDGWLRHNGKIYQ